jgi:predicted TIM-barrel fold metal-dependent hydrolase
MYACKHIERVLRTFPGVFTGIGEFSIHKEFVSAKIAGETASLINPALDSILAFAGKVGLIVILHNDMDMPFAKQATQPVYLQQMMDLLHRNRNTTIIWAHAGLGRVVHPAGYGSTTDRNRTSLHLDILEGILADRTLSHVYFDISWDEVAKYITSSPQALKNTADVINKYPERFLFGTDLVAPIDEETYMSVYKTYDPFWSLLTEGASEKIRKLNYIRLFDHARERVRQWENINVKQY